MYCLQGIQLKISEQTFRKLKNDQMLVFGSLGSLNIKDKTLCMLFSIVPRSIVSIRVDVTILKLLESI